MVGSWMTSSGCLIPTYDSTGNWRAFKVSSALTFISYLQHLALLCLSDDSRQLCFPLEHDVPTLVQH